MAKQMNSKLPSVENAKPIDMNDYKPGEVYVSEPGSTLTGTSTARNGSSIPGVDTVVIELPIFTGSVQSCYGGTDFGRVDIPPTSFTFDDIMAIRRLYIGLSENNAKLNNGTLVGKHNTNHAVRFLLEQLTDAVRIAMNP